MKLYNIIVLIGIIIFGGAVHGQDLEKLVKLDRNAVKISGGLSYNSTVFFSDNPLSKSRPPFAWFASGNISFSAFGMSFPFTYSISNQSKSLSQPSNITAIHPTYKWVKTHIGRTSMTFSPYTLSGINFSGFGIELTPKKFKLSALYGQSSKAVEKNNDPSSIDLIAYDRRIAGLMFGYTFGGTEINFISLKAYDDPNSLHFTYGSSIVKPKDNLVNSVKIRTTIFNAITLEGEGATSIITNNVRIQEPSQSNKWYAPLYSLVRGNATTTAYNAYKASINYTIKTSKLGFTYEKIDPNYQTLGGLFFQNDMENITFTPSFSFLKSKINLTLNTGLQRNNLSKTKDSQTKRWIGSVNLGVRILKNLMTNFTYSNFSSFTRNNPMNDPFTNAPVITDSANVYQISENFTSNANLAIGTKNKKSISTSFTYQVTSNITGKLENANAFGIRTNGPTTSFHSYVNTLGFNQKLDAQEITIAMNANSNLSKNLNFSSWFCGPSLNITKGFGKEKPSVTGGITYNRNYVNNQLSNNVFNYRVNFTHNPKWIQDKYGKLTLSINSMYLQKLPTKQALKKIHELTILFNVGYNFK